jgi:carbon monoxide dehydrogenase subunit G
MVKISKSVFIDAPVEKVFEFFSEPTNLPEIWPSVVEVRDVQRSHDDVKSWRYAYKMAGMKFDGKTEVLEQIENQRSMTHNEGGGLSARIVAE